MNTSPPLQQSDQDHEIEDEEEDDGDVNSEEQFLKRLLTEHIMFKPDI